MNLHLEPLLAPRVEEDRTRLLTQVRNATGATSILAYLQRQAPDVSPIPQTTYSQYHQFERNGYRRSYERIFSQTLHTIALSPG